VIEIEFVDAKVENSITDVSDNLEVYLPTGEIDMQPIITKLTRQKEKLEKEINKLNGMLNNERFVANAPAEVLAVNKKALGMLKVKFLRLRVSQEGLGYNL
jgi:valyl-tRNA synthetase